jgi:hypothetical protein
MWMHIFPCFRVELFVVSFIIYIVSPFYGIRRLAAVCTDDTGIK